MAHNQLTYSVPRFLAPGAAITGKASFGPDSSVWFGAVIRGDSGEISIGARSNIQDGAIVHADAGYPCWIGEDVTLGHASIVHGARIEREVLIGIRATVLNGAVIGEQSIVAAGALVPEGMCTPPRSVVMGIPGKVVRQVEDRDLQRIRHAARHYVELAARYAAGEFPLWPTSRL